MLAHSMLTLLALAARGPQGLEFVNYGPHPVGYRHTIHYDASRSEGPALNWRGEPTQARARQRMDISVWYPARARGRGMTAADYATVTGGTRAAAQQQAAGMARFWLGRPLTDDEAAAAMARRLIASRDAAPRAGRFPVLVANMGHATAAPLAEYLASHGIVVVSTNVTGTASMQVTRGLAALEAHTRSLEVLVGLARDLPFADTTRMAVAGANFDGMAAVLYQMRNMRALAIVSLDGWEGKPNGYGIVTASPSFDERRLRVPYLAFMQADAPSPALGADTAILRVMRYAPRTMYVLPGLGHTHLIGGIAAAPMISDTARASFRAMYETIMRFLERHLVQPSPAAAPLTLEGNVTPQFLAARPALPPVPDGTEFEQLVMTGDTAAVQRVVREALAADSTVRLFDAQTMNLFAFRFSRQQQPAVATAWLRLAVEALPRSARAHFNLGNAHQQAGRGAEARDMFIRARQLVDGDSELSSQDRAALRASLDRALQQP